MVKNEGEKLKKVVVCPPATEYFKVADPRIHNIYHPADKNHAKEQHDRLCRIMIDHGVDVIKITELAGHPNSVFTRDTAVCTPEGYVRARMGLVSRREEEAWMARHLESLGINMLAAIQEPGTLEGGDVILAGDTVFIGSSGRTNDAGVKQAQIIFQNLGYSVRIAPVPLARLHIGGMMSMIGQRRILCCDELFEHGFFDGFETVHVPAKDFVSGNVICLAENVVIAEKSNVAAIACLERSGVLVHAIDLSEFIKGRGGPTCLILPIERTDE